MAVKQAVLLIHGIGEQRPMDTLRSFVDTIWTSDQSIQNKYAGGTLWSQPDFASESFELRRLTTPRNAADVRTDFFEFYWAHLMQGTTLSHLLGWARKLLWRRPGSVPAHLRGVYWILLVAAVVFIVSAFVAAVAKASDDAPQLVPWISALLSLLIIPAVLGILKGVVGDAARYLHIAPGNIQSRHAIRTAGLRLIEELHRRGYSRIIVVGHSLGSVIGYDMLYYAWSRTHWMHKDGATANSALEEVERQSLSLGDLEGLDRYRQAQSAYAEELKANGNPWRVTDFVTLGSPLAHAAILLARDGADLTSKQFARELPTCPPCMETMTENGQRVERFSFRPEANDPTRVPHHAALFAATRWTNLYFPCRRLLWGDIIGGALSPWFGKGVLDVPVQTRQWRGLFSHLLYWRRGKEKDPAHIARLRKAIDLLDADRIR